MGCCKTRVSTDDARTWTFQFFSKQNKIHLFCYMLLHTMGICTQGPSSRWKISSRFLSLFFFRSAGSLIAALPPLIGWYMGIDQAAKGSSGSTQLFLSKCWWCARDLIVFAVRILHSACRHACTPNTLGLARHGKTMCASRAIVWYLLFTHRDI